MTGNVPSSAEVARTEAIANIYRQLADMQFTTADDAYDAALAIAKLSEAESGPDDVSITLVQPPHAEAVEQDPR